MNFRLAGAVRHLMQGAVVEKISSLANGAILLRGLPLQEVRSPCADYSVYALVDFVIGLALGELIVSRCSEMRREEGGQAKAAAIFRSYLLFTLLMMILVTFVAALAIKRVANAGMLPGISFWMLTIAGATAPFRSLVLTDLRIRQDFRRVKQVDIVRCCALTFGYVVFIWPSGLGVNGALGAYALANALGVALVARELAPSVAASISHPDLSPVVRLMGDEGKWQTLRYGVTALHASARPWLIGAVAGIEAVAVFDAAKTATGASLDLLPLKEALVPMMSESVKDPRALRILYLDSVRWGVVLFGAMGAAVAIAAPVVFTFAFPQYQAAIVVTEVLALGFLVSGFAAPQTSLLYALRMQPTYLTTTLLNFALMFLLGVPLMLVWGPSGMAVTLIVTSAIVAAIRHRAISSQLPALRITRKEWLSWRRADSQFLWSLLTRRSKSFQSDESWNAADA